MVYILINVLIVRVYVFIKTHQTKVYVKIAFLYANLPHEVVFKVKIVCILK